AVSARRARCGCAGRGRPPGGRGRGGHRPAVPRGGRSGHPRVVRPRRGGLRRRPRRIRWGDAPDRQPDTGSDRVTPMRRTMCKSKIHRATVTDADLNYEGSITVDPLLLEAADIKPYEQVHVVDVNNGERFVTY